MNDLIKLDWQDQTVTIDGKANELKAAALALAAEVWGVNNAATQDEAVKAQAEITAVLGLVEKARKAAKEPALEFGRRIDDAAKNFVADLKPEQLRIAALVGDFQALEEAKARAAEQLRLAEERKVEEERRQAELAAIRAAEAERQKLAEKERELARLAAETRSKKEKAILAQQQAEIDRQRALSEAKSHAELDRIQEEASKRAAELAAQPKYEPARAEGQRVTTDWDVTVNDIHMLYRAHPNCVKLEPLMSEIKSLLKAGISVKGIVAKQVQKSTTTTRRAIDV